MTVDRHFIIAWLNGFNGPGRIELATDYLDNTGELGKKLHNDYRGLDPILRELPDTFRAAIYTHWQENR